MKADVQTGGSLRTEGTEMFQTGRDHLSLPVQTIHDQKQQQTKFIFNVVSERF